MLIAFTLLSFLTVPLARGTLGRLSELKIRHAWSVAAALFAQIVVISLFPQAHPTLLAVLHLASYGMLGVFLWANRDIRAIKMVAIGWILNFVVIAANGGVMPSAPHLADRGPRDAVAGTFVNSRAVDDARLLFLGDVYASPKWWPLENVFSIGDVLIAAGAFIVVHHACGSVVGRAVDRISPTRQRKAEQKIANALS